MARKSFIIALLLFSGISGARAQSASGDLELKRFFIRQAQMDARYEQEVRLNGEQEELDFWLDQRAFERLLYRENIEAYKVYILAKRDAYAGHQAHCSARCGHGDYYFLHASFYLQLGSDSEGKSWVFGSEESGVGLMAARPNR